MKKTLLLNGLCCAHCAAKIEKAVGKLDGVIMDTEYTAMGGWYIYGQAGGLYGEDNKKLYRDIVSNEKYATDIRADSMQMLGGRASSDEGTAPSQRASGDDYRNAKEGRAPARPAANFSDMDDDIPF